MGSTCHHKVLMHEEDFETWLHTRYPLRETGKTMTPWHLEAGPASCLRDAQMVRGRMRRRVSLSVRSDSYRLQQLTAQPSHGDLMRCLRARLQLRCALVQDTAEPTRSRQRLLGFSKVCVGRMCSHAASCSQSYSRSSHPAPPHLQRTSNHHSRPQADIRL